METERKLDVLADIARALNQSGVTWAVGGSLLLYFKGKTGVFRDIDLMVCETDVEKLKRAMLPLGAPAPSAPNAQYRTRCFLEFTIRGVDVDVMAGFVILENGQEHDCALKPEQVAEHILVRGEDIPLQSLEDWRRYYAWMGRTSKVAMIDGKNNAVRAEQRPRPAVRRTGPLCGGRRTVPKGVANPGRASYNRVARGAVLPRKLKRQRRKRLWNPLDEVWDCPADNRIRHHRRPQGASGLFSDALFRGAERAVRAARPHLRVLVLFAAAAGLWCLLPRLFCPGRHPVFVLRHTGRRRKHKWIGSMILQRWRRC